jgi:hypothetical protein
MTPQRAVAVIQRYHQRVQYAEKRKRGNPINVIRAFTLLRGGKFCERCNCTEYEQNIALHHRDGNWKNYNVSNLEFLCSTCHLNDHNGCWSNKPQEKHTMSRQDTNWVNSPNGTTLYNKVNEMTKTGFSVERACRELSKDSEVLFGKEFRSDTLVGAYYRLRKSFKKNPQTTTKTSQSQMTVQELLEVLQFAKQNNITIVTK